MSNESGKWKALESDNSTAHACQKASVLEIFPDIDSPMNEKSSQRPPTKEQVDLTMAQVMVKQTDARKIANLDLVGKQ